MPKVPVGINIKPAKKKQAGRLVYEIWYLGKVSFMLGAVKWWGPAGGYAFFPGVFTVYSQEFLTEIAAVIEDANAKG